MNLKYPRQIFEKYSNIKLHENPSSGSRVVPRGGADTHIHTQTDGQTERNDGTKRSCLQFCERAFKMPMPKLFSTLNRINSITYIS
jgi:hypothetical protein